MQKLTRIIKDAKSNGTDSNTILNIIREYLQILILKAIYQSKYGRGLSFVGGTCLRICYNLKRFSEDLDFTLDQKIPSYSFSELNKIIVAYLKNTDFDVEMTISEEKVVQKSFIRVSKILHLFGLSKINSQKIHIKLEIDTNPVKVSKSNMETFFVTKFDELFPILKHTQDTMFAGKICAILNRVYTKGRDFYDLLWYLNRKTDINLNYLNKACGQAGISLKFKKSEDVIRELDKKIVSVDANVIMKDIGRFLEDPSEEFALRRYHDVFTQISKLFLKK